MSMARRPLAFRLAMCRPGLRTSTSEGSWMSPPVTVAGPRTSRRSVTGSSDSTRRTRSLRLRMRSVTSSLTPGRVVNSWRASSKRSWVTAAPGIDESRVRRSEFPRVWPKPGSSGEMANRWRLPISSSRGSTVGRWMMSIDASSISRDSLLGVELDDQLFADRCVDVLAQGELTDGDGEAAFAGFEPRRDLTVERVHVVADDDHLLGLLLQRHHVAHPGPVARDRHPAPVDLHEAVAHELASLVPAGPPPGAEGDVVEPELEHPQQVLSGDSRLARRLLVEVDELLLEQPVDAARLLLLAQLHQVLRALTHPVPAVLTRRIRAPLDRALHRVALGALQVQLHLLPAAQAADRSGVSRHPP